MKKLILNCFVIACFAIINIGAQISSSDSEFLAYLNSGEYFAPIFSANLTVEIYAPNKEISSSSFLLYENVGKSIVKFEKPPRDKGKIVLQIDNKYWMYFPKTKIASILSPLTAIAGNASNSDVMREPDSEFYKISLIDHQNPRGNRTVLFEAKNRKAPYGKVITHYDGYKKIYSEIYTRSNILLKTAEFYSHVPSPDGQKGYLPLETKIQDGRNPQKYTIMKFSKLNFLDSINENWFKPNNLKRVR